MCQSEHWSSCCRCLWSLWKCATIKAALELINFGGDLNPERLLMPLFLMRDWINLNLSCIQCCLSAISTEAWSDLDCMS